MSTAEARHTPYEPQMGDVVRDAATRRVGRVMGHVGTYFQVRPLNGGKEWDALPDNLRPAAQSDALSEALTDINSRSRKGGCL